MFFIDTIKNKVLNNVLKATNSILQGGFGFEQATPAANFTKTTYKNLAVNGYINNATIYTCLDLISKNCAEIPWCLKDMSRGEDDPKVITSGEHYDLLMNPMGNAMSPFMFRRYIFNYYLLAGNSYVYANTARGGKRLMNYLLFQPSDVEIKAKNKYEVDHYLFGDENDLTPIKIPAELIHNIKTFNPLSQISGVSPVAAVFRDVDMNNQAKTWNVSLLQNMGRPSAIVSSKNTMADWQFERLEKQIRKKLQGAANAGNVWIGDGDLNYQQTSLTPADMEWLETLKISKREIATTLGVPPELVGDGENKTYSNQQEARKFLYQETCIPLVAFVLDEFNRWLHFNEWLPEQLQYGMDLSSIVALKENENDLYKRLEKADFMTYNEQRVKVGMKENENDPFYNLNKVQRDILIRQAGKPEPKEGQDDDENERIEDDKGKMVPIKVLHKNKPVLIATTNKLTICNVKGELDEKMIYKTINDQREGVEGLIREQIARAFTLEKNEVVRQAEKAVQQWMIPILVEKVLEENFDDWVKIIGSTDRSTAIIFAESTVKQITETFAGVNVGLINANTISSQIDDYIKTYTGSLVKEITTTTQKQIGVTLAEGFALEESIPQLAERIDKLYLDKIIPNRSTVIARTETIRNSNMGSLIGASASPVALKKMWLATPDGRTRPSLGSSGIFNHRLFGKKAPLEELTDPFIISGEKMMFPADVSFGASAGNTIQCRCTMIYRPVE